MCTLDYLILGLFLLEILFIRVLEPGACTVHDFLKGGRFNLYECLDWAEIFDKGLLIFLHCTEADYTRGEET